jgi:hypothetical protein
MRITLNYDYLRYDVEQMVERYSQARIDDSEKRYKANLRSENANEADMIRRLIVSAAGRLRQTLAGYLRIEIEEDDEATSDLGAESIWEFNFKPSVRADVNAMAVVMHHITVRYAMASWCSMQGFMREADAELSQADRHEASLTESLRRGSMPMKEGKAQKVEEDKISVHYGKEG